MLEIKNASSALIIVLHEIYGINDHMQHVCTRLANEGFDVICPNLLPEKQVYAYSEEAIAYQNFRQNVGFDSARQQVETISRQISREYKRVFLVGFSIGATLSWLCSQNRDLYAGVVGFYGSRIREYTQIDPACPVLLFFPRQEASFAVDDLINTLAGKAAVRTIKVDALHGFADPWSKHYCKEARKTSLSAALAFITGYRKSQ